MEPTSIKSVGGRSNLADYRKRLRVSSRVSKGVAAFGLAIAMTLGGTVAAHADPTWYTQCVNGLSAGAAQISRGSADDINMEIQVTRNSSNCVLALAWTETTHYLGNTTVKYYYGTSKRGTGRFYERSKATGGVSVSNVRIAVISA